MSRADRDKWNAKHAAATTGPPSPRLLRFADRLPASGRALDLACGIGDNALWLARERGYVVDAVDCSDVALRILKARSDELAARAVHPILADLDAPPFAPGAARYALVTVTNFLDRRLRNWIQALLAPGGVLFFETFHVGHRDAAPSFRAEWLLERGELRELFFDLEPLAYEEDASRSALLSRRRA